jgi:hypothetical protein
MASRLGQIISDIDKKKENIVSGVGSRLKLLLGDEIRDEKPTLSLPPIGILKNPETKEEFDFAEMASLGVKKASEDQASNKSGWNKFTDTVKTILMANPLFPTNSFQKQVEKVLQPALEKVSQQPAVKKTIESVSDFTSNVIPLIQSLGADKTYEEAVNAWEEGGRNPNNSKVQQFLYQLGESGPQTALGVGLSFVPYLGAPLSTLYWTTISAGEQIEKTGKVSSATNIAIDVVLDRMLGNSLESLFKTPAKTLKNTIVKSFGVEGGTEVAQDILKMANDYQMAETEEGRSAVKDEAKNYFTSGQILMTAGVGGIVGAGIAAPTYGMSKITGKPVVEETREEAIQPEISEETTPEPQKAPSEAVSEEKGIIAQELQPLAQEARKYSSVEEFANSVLYHGSPKSFSQYDLSRAGLGSSGNAFGTGAYFTDKFKNASDYASGYGNVNAILDGKEGTLGGKVLYTIKPPGELLDLNKFLRETKPLSFYKEGLAKMEKAGFIDVSKDPNIIQQLKKGVNNVNIDNVLSRLDIEIVNNSKYAKVLGDRYSIYDYFLPKDKYIGAYDLAAQYGAPGKMAKQTGAGAKDFVLWDKGEPIKMFETSQELTKSQLTDIWNKANKVEPLVEEAKKYKTAEDYVKAQGKTVYRGEGGSNGNGNYFTTDKEFASEFAGIKPLTKAKIPESSIYRPKVLPEAVNESQVTKAIAEAKSKGYKAVYVDEGTPFGEPIESIFVIDKSILKTKSQLTDIWNKAQAIKSIPTAEMKPKKKAVPGEKGIIPQEAQLLPREETKEVITETKPTKKYIEVPRGQLPVKTGGEKAVSSLEARMKGIFERQNVKKVEAEAKERNLDISFYEKMSKPEVLNAAAKFVAKTSQAKVLEILEGKAETPKGLLNNAIMLALEEKSLRDKNIDTAIKLASLRSTRYGQELSILTEVAELSPISAMDSIIRARRDVAEKKMKVGENIRTKKSEKVNEMKKEQTKADLKMEEVEKLLNSIVC